MPSLSFPLYLVVEMPLVQITITENRHERIYTEF